MTNDTYSGNRHIYVGIEHNSAHLIGFHGNIPRWGTSKLGISLITSHLVCFNINLLKYDIPSWEVPHLGIFQ